MDDTVEIAAESPRSYAVSPIGEMPESAQAQPAPESHPLIENYPRVTNLGTLLDVLA